MSARRRSSLKSFGVGGEDGGVHQDKDEGVLADLGYDQELQRFAPLERYTIESYPCIIWLRANSFCTENGDYSKTLAYPSQSL